MCSRQRRGCFFFVGWLFEAGASRQHIFKNYVRGMLNCTCRAHAARIAMHDVYTQKYATINVWEVL